MRRILLAALAALALGAACSGPSETPVEGGARGTAVVALVLDAAPPALATVRLRLFLAGEDVVAEERPAFGARVLFALSGLAPGAWAIVLDGRDVDGHVLLCGRGRVDVAAGVTSQAEVTLVPASTCEPFEMACANGADDDADGASDCADTDCQGALCDDGDACTIAEVCLESAGCGAGTPRACDDGDACNGAEACDPAMGCLAGPPLACDDGDACNGAETCDAVAGCLSGAPPDCDDGIACTVDTCAAATGCVHDAGACDCTVDADCGPAAACTTVRCAPETRTCESLPAADDTPCDDGNGCTESDVCYEGACGRPSEIADDDFEDNDSQATATPIAPDVTLPWLMLIGEDPDWFTLDVCAGGRLTLAGDALDPTSASTIAYELRSAAGTLAAGTFDGHLDEVWTATFDGPVWLRLAVVRREACNALTLAVTFDDAACAPPELCANGTDDDGDALADCADPDCDGAACSDRDRCTTGDTCVASTCVGAWPEDAYEENDTRVTAVPLTLGQTLDGLFLRDGERDWFSIPVVNGTAYTITLTASDRTLVDVGYFSFTLRRADEATLAGGGSYPGHEIVLPWTSFLTATVYLDVTMSAPNGCNGYSVLVTSP